MAKPSRRSFKKKRFSVNYSRKSVNQNNIVSVPGDYPFPNRLKTQLCYVVTKGVTLPSGAAVTTIFRGNSVFDPEQSVSVSTNCNLLETMNDIYSKYGVIASKIEVEIANSDLVPIKVFVFPYQTSALGDINYQTVLAVPHQKHGIVGLANGIGIKRFTHYMTTRTMLDVDPSTDDTAQSLITGTPSAQWFWMIYARAIDDATTGGFTMNIKLTYYTIFSNRKVIAYTG